MFPSDGLFLLKAVDGGEITSSFYLGLSVFLISFFSTTGDWTNFWFENTLPTFGRGICGL